MVSPSLSNGSTSALIRDSNPSRPLEPNKDPGSPESRETNILLQHAENNPFGFMPETLSKMFSPKSLPTLRALGGLAGLVNGLRTDSRSGLSVDETVVDGRNYSTFRPVSPANSELYVDRKRVFGVNKLPERKPKSICQLMWIAFHDKVLILLAIVATISLSLGLYQTIALPHKPGQPRVEWAEGVTIMAAVIIVIVVGALNDYQKELQFARLHRKASIMIMSFGTNC
jgi:P-type Ca2+ transporter type 2C